MFDRNLISLEISLVGIAMLIAFPFIILFIFYYFDKKKVLLRKLKKHQPISIFKVKEKQYAKLIGKAKHVHQPLISPLSKRPCIFYQINVEYKGDKSWHTLIDETKTQDFFLESNGEWAMIKMDQDPANYRIYLAKDHKTKSGIWNDATPQLEAYLKTHGKKSTSFLGLNRTMRYHEGIIEPDETVTVLGIGSWKKIVEPIEGFNYSNILTLSGTTELRLIITDLKQATEKSE